MFESGAGEMRERHAGLEPLQTSSNDEKAGIEASEGVGCSNPRCSLRVGQDAHLSTVHLSVLDILRNEKTRLPCFFLTTHPDSSVYRSL